jgi:alkylation response protein AidB-like acyl-CoA dehydrogenase
MELELSREQEILQNSVRALCDVEMNIELVRKSETDRSVVKRFSAKLADLGFCGLRIGFEHGGTGLGVTELVVAFLELGRALTPGPHLENLVMAPALLRNLDEPAAARYLCEIADGSRVFIPAWQENDGRDRPDSIQSSVCSERGHAVLNGEKLFVAHLELADRLLVLARVRNEDRCVVCVVPTGAEGMEATPQANIADQSMWKVKFCDTPVETVLGDGRDVAGAWKRMFDESLIGSAALAAGGAERVLEITTKYACERKQFGKPIGGFQAIAHYLADAAVEVEGARLLAFRAASAADEGSSYSYFAAVAKLQACKTFRDAAALSIQVHGGLGFTLGGDPQLFFRRAKQQQLLNGSPASLEEIVEKTLFDQNVSAAFRA